MFSQNKSVRMDANWHMMDIICTKRQVIMSIFQNISLATANQRTPTNNLQVTNDAHRMLPGISRMLEILGVSSC